MNPSRKSSEILENKIEMQNVVDATEPENTENVTTVQVFETDNKQQITNDHRSDIEVNKLSDTEVKKQNNRTVCGYYVANQIGQHPQEFWVQFNVAGARHIPEGSEPLNYEPDRNYFVRLVFSIVLFMLILTAGYVMFVYMSDLKYFYRSYGMIIMIVAVIGMLSLNYAMMCSACTRVPPCNFICLFLAVCFMSCICAFITVHYKTDIVLLALLATVVTVIVCLCLACTRFDFTKFLLYVIVIGVAFGAVAMIASISMLVTGTRYKPLILVILLVGTVLNVIVLIMELQMILGGRTVELSEDDYALGAYMLYTSIVDIFIKLVQILGIFDEGF